MGNKIITLGTQNKHKVDKLSWIVDGYFDTINTIAQGVAIEETEGSFSQNAEKKALEVAKIYQTYSIATDGGVLIPSLGSQWNGILTRRFAGEDVDDFQRMDTLLDLMKDKDGNDRRIEWREAIALANEKGILFSTEVEGDWGLLQTEYNPAQYKEGIWVCTLWSYPQFENKNFFDLTDKEKEYGEISWWRLRDLTRQFLGKQLLPDLG